MKAQHVLPMVALLILLSCNSAPQAVETPAAAPATSVRTLVDTTNTGNKQEQAERILQDTAKVGLPLGAE